MKNWGQISRQIIIGTTPVANTPVFIRTGVGAARLYSSDGLTLLSEHGSTSTDADGNVTAYVADGVLYTLSVRREVDLHEELYFEDNIDPSAIGTDVRGLVPQLNKVTAAQAVSGAIGLAAVDGAGQLITPGGVVISGTGGGPAFTVAQTAAGAVGVAAVNAAGQLLSPTGTVITSGGGAALVTRLIPGITANGGTATVRVTGAGTAAEIAAVTATVDGTGGIFTFNIPAASTFYLTRISVDYPAGYNTGTQVKFIYPDRLNNPTNAEEISHPLLTQYNTSDPAVIQGLTNVNQATSATGVMTVQKTGLIASQGMRWTLIIE